MGTIRDWLIEKLNPAQERIVEDFGESQTTSRTTITNEIAYDTLEVVNRGANLIADGCGEILVDVGDKINAISIIKVDVRAKKVKRLLNHQPNPFQNATTFKRQLVLDLIIEGNAFIYWDGGYLYILPAKHVEIVADKKKYIKLFKYNEQDFKPQDIIFIKENSNNPFRGTSRLISANKSIQALINMTDFQINFFKNGTIPGLILKTPNTLSKRVKEKVVIPHRKKSELEATFLSKVL